MKIEPISIATAAVGAAVLFVVGAGLYGIGCLMKKSNTKEPVTPESETPVEPEPTKEETDV